MNIHDKALKRYQRQVRRMLPSRELKKRLMPQINQSIRNFIEINPDADLNMVQQNFGTPIQIAASYLYEQETITLLKELSIRRKILAIISGVLAAMIVVWMGFVTTAAIMVHTNQHQTIYIDNTK